MKFANCRKSGVRQT